MTTKTNETAKTNASQCKRSTYSKPVVLQTNAERLNKRYMTRTVAYSRTISSIRCQSIAKDEKNIKL